MQYGITKLVISCNHFLEISGHEFNEAKLAKRSLVDALGIEEKLDIVIENYAEYEKELLKLSLKNAIFSDRNWSSFQTERRAIDRRLVNLLTACRLYVDQIPHDVNSIYGGGAGKDDLVKQRMSQEYNSNLSYRVLDALRNYVQHRGLPIYHLSYGVARQDNSSRTYLKHTITPSLSVSRLKQEKKFKATVLNELEKKGDLIDLKPLVRQYMESIGRVHLFIREILANELTKWDATILGIQKSFCDGFGETALGLAIVALDGTGKMIDSEHIFEDLVNHRKWLVQKNRMLTRYDSEIISSESQLRDV